MFKRLYSHLKIFRSDCRLTSKLESFENATLGSWIYPLNTHFLNQKEVQKDSERFVFPLFHLRPWPLPFWNLAARGRCHPNHVTTGSQFQLGKTGKASGFTSIKASFRKVFLSLFQILQLWVWITDELLSCRCHRKYASCINPYFGYRINTNIAPFWKFV